MDRYGISVFREMKLDVVLLNDDGEDVELVDASTSDVLDTLEVYLSEKEMPDKPAKPTLKLVIDNSKS